MSPEGSVLSAAVRPPRFARWASLGWRRIDWDSNGPADRSNSEARPAKPRRQIVPRISPYRMHYVYLIRSIDHPEETYIGFAANLNLELHFASPPQLLIGVNSSSRGGRAPPFQELGKEGARPPVLAALAGWPHASKKFHRFIERSMGPFLRFAMSDSVSSFCHSENLFSRYGDIAGRSNGRVLVPSLPLG